MGHFRGKVRGERINRCQPALGRRRTGLSHGIDATLIPLLVWAQSTSVTGRQTNMLLAKRRYTSVLRAKKRFPIFKIRCLSKSDEILSTVVVIQLSNIIITIKSLFLEVIVCVHSLIQDFNVSGGYFCLYFARIVGCLCVRLFACN